MRPVKISIKGSFWDSQIYSGDVIIFSDSGESIHINWRDAINGIANKATSEYKTALRVSFIDGDLFYNEKVRNILRDQEIESIIKCQLKLLADDELEISLDKHNHSKQDSPFDFMPTDTDVYYSEIFATSDEGLFSSPIGSVRKKNPSLFTSKHHDAGFLQVKASDNHTAIAGAAGADGLFEFDYAKDETDKLSEGKILSNKSCKACEWAFQSIIGWSDENAFIASHKEQKLGAEKKLIRTFDRIVDFDETFGPQNSRSFSWGSREKLYRITDGDIQVATKEGNKGGHNKARSDNSSTYKLTAKIHEQSLQDFVISTGTAPFGSVIEYQDKLVVIRSDGATEVFKGELVHWRIFPRSAHYSNQLHLIYEDRLDIISFVHDYFVDQDKKNFGFSKYVSNIDRSNIFL